MYLSIVIPTFNSSGTLGDLFDAIAAQESDHPFEVVVADNGSTDDAVDVATRYAPRFSRLRVVDASYRRGVSHAMTVGARAADGTHLLFVGSDDVVGHGWLDAMSRALEEHDFVAARIDHRLLNPEWTVKMRGEVQSSHLPGAGSYLPYAIGTTIGIRRGLHLDVGGFDESLAAGEDNDYSWRLHALGADPHLVPDAVLHYRHRGRPIDVYRQSRGYGRAVSELLARYECKGMRAPERQTLRAWVVLFLRLAPALRSRERRVGWLHSLGWRVGYFQGRRLTKRREPHDSSGATS